MFNIVFGALGLSTLWFIPLLWRLLKSLLHRDLEQLTTPHGPARFWGSAVAVLLSSTALEGLLVLGLTRNPASGAWLDRSLAQLLDSHLGLALSAVLMLVTWGLALPGYLGFTWQDLKALARHDPTEWVLILSRRVREGVAEVLGRLPGLGRGARRNGRHRSARRAGSKAPRGRQRRSVEPRTTGTPSAASSQPATVQASEVAASSGAAVAAAAPVLINEPWRVPKRETSMRSPLAADAMTAAPAPVMRDAAEPARAIPAHPPRVETAARLASRMPEVPADARPADEVFRARGPAPDPIAAWLEKPLPERASLQPRQPSTARSRHGHGVPQRNLSAAAAVTDGASEQLYEEALQRFQSRTLEQARQQLSRPEGEASGLPEPRRSTMPSLVVDAVPQRATTGDDFSAVAAPRPEAEPLDIPTTTGTTGAATAGSSIDTSLAGAGGEFKARDDDAVAALGTEASAASAEQESPAWRDLRPVTPAVVSQPEAPLIEVAAPVQVEPSAGVVATSEGQGGLARATAVLSPAVMRASEDSLAPARGEEGPVVDPPPRGVVPVMVDGGAAAEVLVPAPSAPGGGAAVVPPGGMGLSADQGRVMEPMPDVPADDMVGVAPAGDPDSGESLSGWDDDLATPMDYVPEIQPELLPHPPIKKATAPLPPLDLLSPPPPETQRVDEALLAETGQLIEQRLREFKVPVSVVGAGAGPVITRFEVEPAVGVRGNQVVALMKDLARGLGRTSIRVVETIPGKTCMGLELPNEQRQMIALSEILSSPEYCESDSLLTLAMGKGITGEPVVADLAKAPHMLVAGTTGSGKSVAVNAMILSMLYKATPEQVRLIMIDPKMLELSVYEGIPHLLAPVVTDMKLAANALAWCVGEMENRYRLMSELRVRNLAGFNQKVRDAREAGRPLWNPYPAHPEVPEYLDTLPMIVVVIDELADLMMVAGKKIEELIARLAQKARAAGIHLILATQRPSVDVITGLIKANIPTRVAFQVSSKIDSRTILDQMGAESLLGQGDMLFLPPGTGYPNRVHGAFVADEEVLRVVAFLKQFGEPDYIDDILAEEASETPAEGGSDAGNAEADPLYDEAAEFVIKTRRASISFVQRQFRIGYNRAARLVEAMEAAGLVSSMGPNGQREVLVPGRGD